MRVRNVCKECLANGYSLELNEELLCSDCAYCHRLDLDKIVYSNHSLSTMSKQMKEFNRAYDAKREREQRNFDFVYGKYTYARELEKQGNAEEALLIYLNIIEYCPPGTDYYTRPCIILEKQKEYDKAIEICDLAIKHIREGRFNADEEEFNHRKERLIKKMSK